MARQDQRLEGPQDSPGDWYYTVEAPTVTAFERSDKSNRVYVRWWYNDLDTKRRGRWKKFVLRTSGLEGAAIGTVRNERGQLLRGRREAVIQALRKVQDGLARGAIDPATGELAVQQKGQAIQEARFTLAEGRAAIFDVDTGRYIPTGDSDRDFNLHEMKRAQRYLEDTWGPDTPYSKLPKDASRVIWRKLARAAGSAGRSGKRDAERFIGYLHRTAKWLASKGHIAEAHAPYLDGWKREFREEWERLTGESTAPTRRRHTDQELELLTEHLDQAEPRLRLMMLIGMELRLGQVRRAMRSHLDLGEGVGAFGLGSLTVAGAGKKKGAHVHLDPEQRAALDYELNLGYLRECEAAYREGRIKDYSLFPQGRTRRGAIPVRKNDRYLRAVGKSTMNGWFKALEEAAGVPHVDGRAWYGVRRITTDLAPTYTKDTRVLDAMGGWSKGSKMREGIYQDEERDEVARAAADARYRMRQGRVIAPDALELHAKIESLLQGVEDPEILRSVLAAVAGTLARQADREQQK